MKGTWSLQREDVIRAYVQLIRQRREPSLLNLRLQLGYGSYSTIAAHLDWIDRPVIAVMTAGRGRVVWSRYEHGRATGGPRNTTVDELRGHLDGELVAGEIELLTDLETTGLPAGARVEQIARLAWRRFLAGEQDDAASLEPVYAHGRRQDATPK